MATSNDIGAFVSGLKKGVSDIGNMLSGDNQETTGLTPPLQGPQTSEEKAGFDALKQSYLAQGKTEEEAGALAGSTYTFTAKATNAQASTSNIQSGQQAEISATEKQANDNAANLAKQTADANKSALDSSKKAQEDLLKSQQLGVDTTQTVTEGGVTKTVTPISDAEKLAQEKQKALAERATELAAIEAERQAQVARDAEAQKRVLEQKLAAQKETDRAALEKQKSDNALAVHEAELKQESARIAANINLSKLGLLGSAAAITTVQSIANDGSMKIANLKVQAAALEASNAMLAQSIELSYVTEMNKITDGAGDKIYESKKRVYEGIVAIQDNIFKTEKEKNDDIQKIIGKAKEDKRNTEKDMFQQIVDTQELLRRNIEFFNKQRDEELKRNNDKVSEMQKTGAWDRLTSSEKAEWERKTEKAPGSLDVKKREDMYAILRTEMDVLAGKDFIIPEDKTALIFEKAQFQMSLGVGMEEAMRQATMSVLNDIPEYAEKKKAKAEEAKAKAEKLASETLENISSADLNKAKISTEKAEQLLKAAQAAKAGRVGSGASGKDVKILKTFTENGIVYNIYSDNPKVSVPVNKADGTPMKSDVPITVTYDENGKAIGIESRTVGGTGTKELGFSKYVPPADAVKAAILERIKGRK